MRRRLQHRLLDAALALGFGMVHDHGEALDRIFDAEGLGSHFGGAAHRERAQFDGFDLGRRSEAVALRRVCQKAILLCHRRRRDEEKGEGEVFHGFGPTPQYPIGSPRS